MIAAIPNLKKHERMIERMIERVIFRQKLSQRDIHPFRTVSGYEFAVTSHPEVLAHGAQSTKFRSWNAA